MRHTILLSFFGGVLLTMLSLPISSIAKTIIFYPRYDIGSEFDPDGKFEEDNNNYWLQLLSLCLGKTGDDFELQQSKTPSVSDSRAFALLRQGKDVDVVWTMTSKEREEALLPIRIPIDRGVIGWRIFLINKNDQSKFGKVKTLDDLKKLVAGQGVDWPDAKILSANGLPVVSGNEHAETLPKMLKLKRFDYFPRSIEEIWREVAIYPKFPSTRGLVVENTIALHYPTTSYFFVNKNNQKLASNIKNGCEKAIKDGSFQLLFDKFYGQYITWANLKNRKVFHLQNPLLSSETPLNKKEYWFSPETH